MRPAAQLCVPGRTEHHTADLAWSAVQTDTYRTQQNVSSKLQQQHKVKVERGLTSQQTHDKSYRGRVFMGQMTQPTW